MDNRPTFILGTVSTSIHEVGLLAKLGEEYAWIRTRKTGKTWHVHGSPLERALRYPDQYEILEPDAAGNYIGEKGEIVVEAALSTEVAPLPEPEPEPIVPPDEPVKLVIKGKGRWPKAPVDEDEEEF